MQRYLTTLLRALLLVLAWLAVAPAQADAQECGKSGQRGCCVVGNDASRRNAIGGACEGGLIEKDG